MTNNTSSTNPVPNFYRASAADFKKIPGSPIAYWISKNIRNAFLTGTPLSNLNVPRQGFATGDNDTYLRQWSEVQISNIGFNCKDNEDSVTSGYRWFPCNKGGTFRKWFGNNNIVADWENDGERMKKFKGSVIRNPNYYFKEGMTWSTISSSKLSMRYSPMGFLFETKGSVCFPLGDNSFKYCLGLMNCKVVEELLLAISPTLDFHEGPIGKTPVILSQEDKVSNIVSILVKNTKSDWDSYETSWDFTSLPLLNSDYRQSTLKTTYQKLRSHWREMTREMKRLEEENNSIFIEAYGLQDELKPDVPLNEITLTCNPHYRYSGDKSEEELEAQLLADTLRELVSYAVGCMFGRYSLDKPGLILANQGETIEDYLIRVPDPSFPADDDNVIPMLDGDWFTDDIVERFRKFLRLSFGEEHYEENLKFVEQALNIKNKRNYSLRSYFLGEFYSDHVRRYKKRPIYWLFSSPKGSFNALIYMHRYRPDTVSVVLNDYLREFTTKLTSHMNHLEAVSISEQASQSDKTQALKEIEKNKKIISELEEYERNVLYPLATEQVAIDLDDGVKVNYPKLGTALKKIVGLEAKRED
jgi:type II restriction/modification system DNA methylase subunit YeeA